MRALVGLLIVVVPGVAHADKHFLGGRGATWDCAKDPVVHIDSSNGKYQLRGPCTEIHVNGSHDALAIESVRELHVNGGHNVFAIASAGDAVHVNGASNSVHWTSGNPEVHINGAHNDVAGSATGGGAAAGGASGTTIDCAKQPSMTIADNDGHYVFAGACESITIAGNHNEVVVESAKSISLPGNHNKLAIAAADEIEVAGNHNQVAYKKGVTRALPRVSAPGNHNQVDHVK